jgi:FtsP/CotA-like multicopper oxidase with cupredoxin domain
MLPLLYSSLEHRQPQDASCNAPWVFVAWLTRMYCGRLQQLVVRALAGESDRSLKFGRGEGMWLFNGRGWDKNDNLGKGKHIEFDDVGQNTVELWTLEAGGGWVHPVHIHLVVSAPAVLIPHSLHCCVAPTACRRTAVMH